MDSHCETDGAFDKNPLARSRPTGDGSSLQAIERLLSASWLRLQLPRFFCLYCMSSTLLSYWFFVASPSQSPPAFSSPLLPFPSLQALHRHAGGFCFRPLPFFVTLPTEPSLLTRDGVDGVGLSLRCNPRS